MAKYQYVGNGVGLPGLPNLVTDEEAQAAGMADVLESAVLVGLYVEVTPPPAPPKTKSAFGEGSSRKSLKGELSDG